MQLELVEVLDLLLPGLAALDDDLARGVSTDEAFVHGVEDCAFELVVEVHRRLAFVMLGVAVDELLILDSVEVCELEGRRQLPQPCHGELVLSHGDVANCPVLVHFDPLCVIVVEQAGCARARFHGRPFG